MTKIIASGPRNQASKEPSLDDRASLDDEFELFLREAAYAPPAPLRAEQAALDSGTVLLDGRFTVQGCLGEGGMGVVYDALDHAHDVQVALKTLSRVEAGSVFALKNEFRSLSDVVHPNLVGLRELFCDGDLWFFTMDLVTGVEFIEYVSNNAEDGMCFDKARLRGALLQLVEGVGAIHAAGKLHRDIKPSNVLVRPDGRVVVLDFGLIMDQSQGGAGDSRPISGRSGTPEYMAPEQLMGKALTAASDWYAVGVMLFKALTGGLPKGADNHAIPEPRSLASGVPEDLNDICTALLQKKPSARPEYSALVERLSAKTPEEKPVLISAVPPEETFVGRFDELAELKRSLGDVGPGAPVIVHLHGASGMGKTALLTRFSEYVAGRGKGLVLGGRCYERESVPFKALDQVVDNLSHYLRGLSAAELHTLLPDEVALLARVFPVLRRVDLIDGASQGEHPEMDVQELRRRAFNSLRELLVQLCGEREVVVAIDDLQWGDSDSGRLISRILSSATPPGLLLVLCYRTEEAATSEALSVLAENRALPAAREVELEPMRPGETRELVETILGDHALEQEQIDTITANSGGIPFLLGEMVRFLLQGNTRDEVDLPNALEQRINLLSPEARELLALTCVAAKPFSQSVLLAAAGDSVSVETIQTLRALKMIRTHGVELSKAMEPYHDRIRETVTASLRRSRLTECHRALAETLENVAEPDLEALALHFKGAEENTPAVAYGIKAAVEAEQALAFDHAAILYERALELLDKSDEQRPAVEVRRAQALADAGNTRKAHRAFLQAADQFTGEERADLRWKSVQQMLMAGETSDARGLLRYLLPDFGLSLPLSRVRIVAGLLSLRLRLALKGTRIPKESKSVSTEEQRRVDICTELGMMLFYDEAMLGIHFMTAAASYSIRSSNRAMMATALAFKAQLEAIQHPEREKRVRATVQKAVDLAREYGDPYNLAYTLYYAGHTYYLLGLSQTSSKLADESELVFREQCVGVASVFGAQFIRSVNTLTLCYVGDFSAIRPKLKEGRAENLRYKSKLIEFAYYMTASLERLASDDPEEALEFAQRGFGKTHAGDFLLPDAHSVMRMATIDVYRDRPHQTWQMMTKHWHDFKRTGVAKIKQPAFHINWVTGSAALAYAEKESDRKKWIKRVRRRIGALDRLKFIPAVAASKGLCAGLANLNGNTEEAVRLLAESSRLFGGHEMPNWSACATRCQGLVIGGDEGAELVREADAALTELGVFNPARWAAAWFPGFE